MSDFIQQQNNVCAFSSSDSWVILSPIEQSIKHKIEAIGTPLKDWDIQINYGIKTGFNDAFIISTEKRNEILDNCKDLDERHRTEELIRPILRGRDIKRYGYIDNGLYLINVHNGIKGRVPRIKIEDYPAIKTHLDKYWDNISKRADKGDTPYNLRNCAYLDLLNKPKIVWGEISDKTKFCIDEEGLYSPEATTFMLSGKDLYLLLAFLNCPVSEYMFSKIGTTTGVGTVRWKKFKIEQLFVPSKLNETIKLEIERVCRNIIHGICNERAINELIYRVFNLNENEIEFIENYKNTI